MLALGRYPDVSLSRAREKRDAARRLVADGFDPAVQRLVEKNAKVDTFAAMAAEWLGLQRKRFAPATMEKAEWTFRDPINPYIGNRPIAEIMPLELLTFLDVLRLAVNTNCSPHEAALRPGISIRSRDGPRYTRSDAGPSRRAGTHSGDTPCRHYRATLYW